MHTLEICPILRSTNSLESQIFWNQIKFDLSVHIHDRDILVFLTI